LLRGCQECAKLSSRQRVAPLKNLKYDIYFDLFIWLPYVLFHIFMSPLLFNNVKTVKIKKNPWMSRCVQTFDWYIYINTRENESLQYISCALINLLTDSIIGSVQGILF
jgi:hypothetical protein